MNGIQTIRMAFKSILNNKVRSFLTMLGIIIGVGAVIALVASIQGMATLTRLQYEAMGTNQITASGWALKSADWDTFEDMLDGELADRIKGWSPQSSYYDWQSKGVQYRTKVLSNQESNTRIYFGNQDYSTVTNMTLTAGRDISETDCRYRARVCLIGEAVRKYFFGAMSPIGQDIRRLCRQVRRQAQLGRPAHRPALYPTALYDGGQLLRQPRLHHPGARPGGHPAHRGPHQ